MTKETLRATFFMWAAMLCTVALVEASASQSAATLVSVATIA
jgi:hypothetical protein